MNNNSILYDKHHPPPLDLAEDLDDDELFRLAMSEVKPLARGRRSRRTVESNGVKHAGEERIVLPGDEFEEFLRSQGSRVIDQAEHLEGGPEEWNRLLLKKLSEGDFMVQAELDLHGFSRAEARGELRKFIEECSRRNLTCVRIVHGKGNNSRNGVPILKRHIPLWLSQKRLARRVVAYTSARQVDGGIGAIYVLLRKA